jgi:hypothetical protein
MIHPKKLWNLQKKGPKLPRGSNLEAFTILGFSILLKAFEHEIMNERWKCWITELSATLITKALMLQI